VFSNETAEKANGFSAKESFAGQYEGSVGKQSSKLRLALTTTGPNFCSLQNHLNVWK
jgi:hypothetical protein